MKKTVFLTFAVLTLVSMMTKLNAQVGIGTDAPTNTLHVKPTDPNEDPLRVENLNELLQGDTALLIVNPVTGVVRYVRIDDLLNHMTTEIDRSNTNELQSADEVDLAPNIDFNNNGIVVKNVQEALEAIQKKSPKGTFKSIAEARNAGLIDGDSFYTDPKGRFGCSGCIITLYPGMK